jgi:hypothetical protein
LSLVKGRITIKLRSSDAGGDGKMEMKAKCTCEESSYCHEEEVGPWCNGCKFFEVTFLKGKTESGAKLPCSDVLCALLETWKEVFEGFDRLIEAEQVIDLKNMLIGSKNATKELMEHLERVIKESA